MSFRKTARIIASPRQRIYLAPVGIDDRMETGNQASNSRQSQNRSPHAASENSSESQKQRLFALADLASPRLNARIQKQRQNRSQNQRQNPPAQSLRHISAGIARLFRSQRNLLYRQIKPDGKWHSLGHAYPPERQKSRVAALWLNVGSQAPAEIRDCPDPEDEQNAQSQKCDENRESESRDHAGDVYAHEDAVEHQPPYRGRHIHAENVVYRKADIAADAHHYHRRGEYVFNALSQPRHISAPRPH